MRRRSALLGCAALVALAAAFTQMQLPTLAQSRARMVIVPMDEVMRAVKRANLRAGPGTSFDKVGLLEIGDEVRATGRIGDWLRVQRSSGRTAFVYGPLLSTRPAAELGASIFEEQAPATPRRDQSAQENRQVIAYDHGRYEGEVRNGKRHGQGIMTGHNGHRYEGEWRNDRRHGRGIYTWPSGMRYEGEWRSGKHHGQGTKVWPGGDRYDGEWRIGRRHGRGTYTWPDGTRYEGEWNNGKRHGRGTYVSADGTTGEGEWRNDRMVRRPEPPPDRRRRPAVARRKPAPGVVGALWGAIVHGVVDEHMYYLYELGLDPPSNSQCRNFAGMAWNFATKAEAVKAAWEKCREQWDKSGLRVPVDIQYEMGCGATVEDIYTNATFGGNQPETCGAYAEGRFDRCGAVGIAVAPTKRKAEQLALDRCGFDSCRIAMSQCVASP